MALCQLCGNDRNLINAHIIPKSFWKFDKVDGRPLAVFSSRPNWRPQRSQQGEYDDNILCEECDNKLGVFDQHAYENLVIPIGTPYVKSPQVTALKYNGADGKIVHAFVASLAWRASKSQRNYFCRINLGPYEDLLRASFEGDVSAMEFLDCFIAEFDNRDGLFLNPQYSRMEGVKFAVFYANRFTFYIKVDKQKTPATYGELIVRAGKPVISVVRSWEGSEQHEAMVKVVKSNPRPNFWGDMGQ